MAERIVRQLGFTEFDYLPPVPLSERLSWAIMAMEEAEPGEEDPREPGADGRSSVSIDPSS